MFENSIKYKKETEHFKLIYYVALLSEKINIFVIRMITHCKTSSICITQPKCLVNHGGKGSRDATDLPVSFS